MRRLTVAAALLLGLALAGCGSGGDESEVASASGGTATPGASASSTLSQEDRAVKFAQCMREHGVDVPDPKPGQKGVRFTAEPGGKHELESAMEACRKYSPQATESPGQAKKRQENARKFAACMREHGVEDFPDPEPDQKGIQVDKSLASDPDFEDAQKACQDILGGKRKQGGD